MQMIPSVHFSLPPSMFIFLSYAWQYMDGRGTAIGKRMVVLQVVKSEENRTNFET